MKNLPAFFILLLLFTDYALYPVKNLSQIGTVDPSTPIKILNSLAILFFDKYLRNESNVDVGKSCRGFDVEYVSNVVR